MCHSQLSLLDDARVRGLATVTPLLSVLAACVFLVIYGGLC